MTVGERETPLILLPSRHLWSTGWRDEESNYVGYNLIKLLLNSTSSSTVLLQRLKNSLTIVVLNSVTGGERERSRKQDIDVCGTVYGQIYSLFSVQCSG